MCGVSRDRRHAARTAAQAGGDRGRVVADPVPVRAVQREAVEEEMMMRQFVTR